MANELQVPKTLQEAIIFYANPDKCYVNGHVHANGIENFWSLLKRTIKGTYVAVDVPHLDAYLDEQAFRFNERKDSDAERFEKVIRGIDGKRITYKGLVSRR